MKLGDNILKLRKQQGLSQEELGELVNVTRQTISNWELNETSPNPEQLKLLSKALNISIDDLINNEISKNISIDNLKQVYLPFCGLILVLVIALVITLILLFREKDKHIFKLNETTRATTSTSKHQNNDTFIRTYEVLEINKVICSGDIVGCDNTTYEITLKQCQGETHKLQVSNISDISKVQKGKVYEFKFEPVVGEIYYEDTITNLFAFNRVLSITETNNSCSKQIQEPIKTRS